MLYVDRSFLPKLRKCRHEVTIDLCGKPRMALQVSSIEVMTFLFGDQPHFGSHPRFPEIVAQRDDDLQ